MRMLAVGGVLGAVLIRETAHGQEAPRYQPGDIIRRGDRTQPFFNETYDDFLGNKPYVESNLGQLLELGRKRKTRFTFFPVGTSLQTAPVMWRQAYDEGHEIENHTMNHLHLNTLSTQQIRNEISQQQRIAKQLFGENYTQRFLRPPFGDGIIAHFDPRIQQVAREFGLIVAMWSADSRGWALYPRRDTQAINTIVNNSPAIPGDLILQHGLPADVIAAEYILQNGVANGVRNRTLANEVDNVDPDQ